MIKMDIIHRCTIPFDCPSFPSTSPYQSFEFGDEPANFGDSVTVQCTISKGDLPVDITWLFNDYAINEYHGVTSSKIGKKVNVLTIDSVNGNNAGNYTCRARNKAQMVEYTAALIVNGGIEIHIHMHIP